MRTPSKIREELAAARLRIQELERELRQAEEAERVTLTPDTLHDLLRNNTSLIKDKLGIPSGASKVSKKTLIGFLNEVVKGTKDLNDDEDYLRFISLFQYSPHPLNYSQQLHFTQEETQFFVQWVNRSLKQEEIVSIFFQHYNKPNGDRWSRLEIELLMLNYGNEDERKIDNHPLLSLLVTLPAEYQVKVFNSDACLDGSILNFVSTMLSQSAFFLVMDVIGKLASKEQYEILNHQSESDTEPKKTTFNKIICGHARFLAPLLREPNDIEKPWIISFEQLTAIILSLDEQQTRTLIGDARATLPSLNDIEKEVAIENQRIKKEYSSDRLFTHPLKKNDERWEIKAHKVLDKIEFALNEKLAMTSYT